MKRGREWGRRLLGSFEPGSFQKKLEENVCMGFGGNGEILLWE